MPNWKKEIKLSDLVSRRDKSADAEKEAKGAPDTPEAEPTPFWKKEVSLRRKPRAAEVAPAADPIVPDQIPEPPPVSPAMTAPPAPAIPPVPPEAPSYDWLTAELAPSVEADAVSDPATSVAADEPTAIIPPAALPPPPPTSEAGWPAEPELPPAPESFAPAPAAEVIHPPVPAAELPPVPPSAPPPVIATPDIHPPVAAADLPPLPTPKKPSLLKRELSFGRKRRAPADSESTETDKPSKPSLLKRDISFGRKPKAANGDASKPTRSAKTPKSEKQKTPSGEKAPKVARTPRRREGKAAKAHRRLVGLKIGASQLAAARVVNIDSAELVKLSR